MWKKRWDFLLIIMILFSTILTPIEISFQIEQSNLDILENVGHALDFLYLFDIIITLRTANINEHGFIILNQKTIIRNYIKGWFFLDLLSALPFDLLFTALSN